MAWFAAGSQSLVPPHQPLHLDFSIPQGNEICVVVSSSAARDNWWQAGWITQLVQVAAHTSLAATWEERLPLGASLFRLPHDAPCIVRIRSVRWLPSLSAVVYYASNTGTDITIRDAGTYA